MSLPICSTLGVDFVCLSGRRPAYFLASASFCSLVLLGGSFGSDVGSYSGARTRFAEPFPQADVSEVAFETPDTDDLAVTTELTDSFEPRRLRPQSFCDGTSEGRRGGSAGDACSEGLLGGKLGPTDACDVRDGRGGLGGTFF